MSVDERYWCDNCQRFSTGLSCYDCGRPYFHREKVEARSEAEVKRSQPDRPCLEHDWESVGVPQGVYQCRRCGEIG
jgi:hypothetical protein